MKASARIFFAFVVSIACLSSAAASGPESARKALVLGNGSYAVTPLKNPVNDARDMARLLRTLGFDVSVLIDSRGDAMMKGIREFAGGIGPGDTALFYFSGHGVQISGTNYLIPIDNDITTVEEVALKAPSVDYVLSKLEAAGSATNIVILDACRNNPFSGSERSAWRGLANVSYPVSGTIVVYATAPGSVAADGTGRNGVFTRCLLQRLPIPGFDIESALRLVRDDVIGETGGLQIPWSNSSLRGPGFFFAGNAPRTGFATLPAPVPLDPEGMALVTGGEFMMGYAGADEDERPVHAVTLADFYMAPYEVSYAEYDEYCEAVGRPKAKDSGSGRAQRPVAFVNWFEACEYCNWRSAKEGLPAAYEIGYGESGKPERVVAKADSTGYRLPTEAEWEYAARGGRKQSPSRFPGGDELGKIAVWKENSDGQTRSGGSKRGTALDIFDMAGNVWEWCFDWYGPYSADAVAAPQGNASGTLRILRGGGYNTATVAYYSVSNRGSAAPLKSGSDIGFRLVRSAR